MKWLISLYNFGCIVFSLATLLSIIAPFIDPRISSWLAVFGLVFPWLIAIDLMMLFIGFIVKSKWKYLLIFIMVCGFYPIKNLFQIHHDNINFTNSYVTITSFNTQEASKIQLNGQKNRKNLIREYQDYLHLLKNSDILTLQEVDWFVMDNMKKTLDLPFIFKEEERYTAILSKYPIINKGLIDFGTLVNSCIWADIKTPHGIVRVYNVHLHSNRFDRKDFKFIEHLNIFDKELLYDGLTILKKYNKYIKKRAEQANIVKNHSNSTNYPVIICGDFNDHSQSYTYSILSEELDDSFIKNGNGIGVTYNGKFPSMRIDFILVEKDFNINSHKIIEGNFSDHFAIQSKISIDLDKN